MNKKSKATITAIGAYVPEDVLTNEMLEKMVNTSDEWIVSRTGIKERRILKDPKKATSYMAIKAYENLLEQKEIDPSTIDLVIVATITPDVLVAPTGVYVATQIGATNAFSFDLQAACSGFLYGMSLATSYIESGKYKKVLLLGSDKMSSLVDYKDRSTCILFGDGAGAVLFEPSENNYGWEDEILHSNGVGREYLQIKGGGSLYPFSHKTLENGYHKLYQDGKTVFKYAVLNMFEVSQKIIKKNNLKVDDIDYFIVHQANKRIIDAVSKKIGILEEKVLMNIQRYGNTTAATIPLLLNDYKNLFKKGNKIIFVSFGGGFTWGAGYLTWSIN